MPPAVSRLLRVAIGRSAVALATLAVLLILVPPENFGQLARVMAVPAVFSTLATLGLDRAIVSAPDREQRCLRAACLVTIGCVSLLSGLVSGLTLHLFDSPTHRATELRYVLAAVIGTASPAVAGFQNVAIRALLRAHAAEVAARLGSSAAIVVTGVQIISVALARDSFDVLLLGTALGTTLAAIRLFSGIPPPVDGDTPKPSRVILTVRANVRLALARLIASGLSAFRTQMVYIILSAGGPARLSLTGAVKVADVFSGASSSIVERSWGAHLATLDWRIAGGDFQAPLSVLLGAFRTWFMKRAVSAVLAAVVLGIGMESLCPADWRGVMPYAPTLVFGALVTTLLAWTERISEYARRGVLGVAAELLASIPVLSGALFLLISPSISAGGAVMGISIAMGQALRCYVSTDLCARTERLKFLAAVIGFGALVATSFWIGISIRAALV